MYIERDKLLRQLEIIPSYGRYIDIEAVEGLVRDMPAADVVPVMHGCWEKEGTCGKCDKMCCTACNCLLLVDWFDRSMVYRYCPNCGARMGGGSDG